MSLTIFGEKGFHAETEDLGDVITDRYGLETGSVGWRVPLAEGDKAGVRDLRPRIGDAHPLFSWLTVVRRRTKFEPGICRIACDYEGVEQATDLVYELETGLSEEPIETHPGFLGLAGTPEHPYNGAIFSGDTFVGFSPWYGSTRLPNFMGGVTSYLDFSKAVWTATHYVPKAQLDLQATTGTLGLISVPLGNPPVFDDRTWLYMGFNSTERGSAAQVKHQWMLSGRGGWNRAVYATARNQIVN